MARRRWVVQTGAAAPRGQTGGVRSVALVLSTGRGGIARHVRSLATGLTTRGVGVELLCPPAVAALPELAGTGARVMELQIAGGARDAVAVAGLRRTLRDEPVDVVHAHGLAAGAVAALARPPGLPLVVTWHEPPPARGMGRPLWRGVARGVATAARVNLCATADLLREVTELGAADARAAMIAAPRLAPPRRTAAQVRTELGLSAASPIILAAGRLDPYHRYDVLIAAAQPWRELSPAPVVLIAGVGPSYRRLAAQAAVARAPVIMLGERGDVADLLHAADLAVVTSDGARPSVFAREVLAAGVPLVATDVAGLAELAGAAALLVAPGDVEALDATVRALLADPSARAKLATTGLARARTWPTEADALAQAVGVYAELAERSGAART